METGITWGLELQETYMAKQRDLLMDPHKGILDFGKPLLSSTCGTNFGRFLKLLSAQSGTPNPEP